MNSEALLQKLFSAARSVRTSEHVPFAFEKRIMSALAGTTFLDPWVTWGTWLWRALAPCAAVMILVAAASSLKSDANATDPALELDSVLLSGLELAGYAP